MATVSLSAKTRDTIVDFNAGNANTAVDKIDLSAIDAIPGGADDAFQFVSGGFSAAGQVGAIQVGQDVLIRINTIGAATPEMSILLLNTSLADIGASDFIL